MADKQREIYLTFNEITLANQLNLWPTSNDESVRDVLDDVYRRLDRIKEESRAYRRSNESRG